MPQTQEPVNILLVDDMPEKLLSYEVVLAELGENLIKADSANAALEYLLKIDIAVVLADVCMPDLDGFQLASMIREHPRFKETAIIFVSAVNLTDLDFSRGYELGAVDYVPVPVIPAVLRAKVKIFSELYRKKRQLEALNQSLERRVIERTADLEASNAKVVESESRRSLALEAGRMGSWDWNFETGHMVWDAAQCQIAGIDRDETELSVAAWRRLVHPEDLERLKAVILTSAGQERTFQTELRFCRPDGQIRWCICAGAVATGANERIECVRGVTLDITDRKELEERQALLAREVDHRAKNALAVVQSMLRLTPAESLEHYIDAVEGRIGALATVHEILSESRWEGAELGHLVREEMTPYRSETLNAIVVEGPVVSLSASIAQTIAICLHELATNAAKHGSLRTKGGQVSVRWRSRDGNLQIEWSETGGQPVKAPTRAGFGTKVILNSLERQLRGSVKFDWKPQGLHCLISIPHTQEILLKTDDPSAVQPIEDGAEESNLLAVKAEPAALIRTIGAFE